MQAACRYRTPPTIPPRSPQPSSSASRQCGSRTSFSRWRCEDSHKHRMSRRSGGVESDTTYVGPGLSVRLLEPLEESRRNAYLWSNPKEV
ncbi:hypothetical protein MPLSOD_40235 [Mesorhizobium sp. SOD10]|nr:hypothetical protein MPLSOD_40235 [Mesorhizobium sp. SOD10]